MSSRGRRNLDLQVCGRRVFPLARRRVKECWVTVMCLVGMISIISCDDSESPTEADRSASTSFSGLYTGTESTDVDFCLGGRDRRSVEVTVHQSSDEFRLTNDLFEASGTIHEDGAFLLRAQFYDDLPGLVSVFGFVRQETFDSDAVVLFATAQVEYAIVGDAVCFARMSYDLIRRD